MSDEYRAAQRTRIVDSAMLAFARKGLQGTSMSDIITESGMSAGAIYAYFPGKADIITEVAGRVLGARILNIEQLSKSELIPPPSVLVRRVLSGLGDELGRPSLVLQVWAEAVTDPVLKSLANKAFGQLLAAFTMYLTSWHRTAHHEGANTANALARAQAPLLLSACQGYLVQLALIDDFDSDFYLEHVVAGLPQ